jgi:hypothetical protein
VSGVLDPVTSFINVYVLPYLPTLAIILLAVAFAGWVNGRGKASGQRRALREELALNFVRANEIVEFVDTQKVGESYVTPIPRFSKTAYDDIRRTGNLSSLKRGLREDLMTIYSAIDRIDDASDRQEELLVGAPATSPIAVELRTQNLSYIRDTIFNVVLPRLERFRILARR